MHSYGPSVCLLHVVVEFLDKQSGKPIQIAVDALGKPQVDDQGMVQLDSGGTGRICKSTSSAPASWFAATGESSPITTSPNRGGTTTS